MKKLLLITLLVTHVQLIGTLYGMNYSTGITKKPGRIPLDSQYNEEEYRKVEHYMYLSCTQCPTCSQKLDTGARYPMVFSCRFLCCLQCLKADPKLTCLTCGMECDQALLKKRIQSLEGH